MESLVTRMLFKMVVSVFALTLIAASGMASGDPVMLKVSESEEYGRYLTDSKGRALYLFEADRQGMGYRKTSSECYAECAKAWPPLVTHGAPLAGSEVDDSLVGTAQRLNGATQVTYDGWPLYYFRGDEAPGQTRGQNIEGFGGEWYLVTPDGDEIQG